MSAKLNPKGMLSKVPRSPLAPLDNPNDTGAPFGALQYPINLDDIDFGHFIMFHVVETVRGSGKISSNFARGFLQAARNPYLDLIPGPPGLGRLAGGLIGGVKEEIAAARRNQTGTQAEIVLGGRKRIQETRKAIVSAGGSTEALVTWKQNAIATKTVNTIILYMPERVTTAYGIDYQGAELAIAAAGIGSAEALVNVASNIKDILSGGTSIEDTVKTSFLKGLGQELALAYTSKFIDALGSAAGLKIGAAGALEKNIRKVLNPHMQFLYRAVNQRLFEYTFTFAPKNSKESESIDNIIRAFKYYSHPELLVEESGSRFHGYPAEFDIQYYSKEKTQTGETLFQENDWLNRIGRCYLAGVAVDYSSAGTFSTFSHHESPVPEKFLGETSQRRSGNPPTFVTLTLKFGELETLNRKHILEGF